MPLYEYSCDKCNKHFEVIVSLDEKKKVKCPYCKKVLQKLMSAVMFIIR